MEQQNSLLKKAGELILAAAAWGVFYLQISGQLFTKERVREWFTPAKEQHVANALTPGETRDGRNTSAQKQASQKIAADPATLTLKELQPQFPNLEEAVEAYTFALESTISGAELVVSEVTTFANSPEIRKAFATDPRATQRTVNGFCSKCYDAFNRQANKNWNLLQDALVSDKTAKAFVKVGLQPESSTKVVLSRILDNCEKARRKLNRISTVRELEVADQMKQVNEARADLAPLAKEMRAELELLRAMIQSADKS